MRVVLKNWTVFQVSFRASWMDPQCAYMYLVVNDPSVQSLATHTHVAILLKLVSSAAKNNAITSHTVLYGQHDTVCMCVHTYIYIYIGIFIEYFFFIDTLTYTNIALYLYMF